jgi:hypothetical protein
MSICPVNPVPNLRCVPQALCRHRIFIRRGAAAGMSLCPDAAVLIPRQVVKLAAHKDYGFGPDAAWLFAINRGEQGAIPIRVRPVAKMYTRPLLDGSTGCGDFREE